MSRYTRRASLIEEAETWRKMAAEFLTAKRSVLNDLFASGPVADTRFAHGLSYIGGVCGWLDQFQALGGDKTMIRRMRRRILKHKPKRAKVGAFWWIEFTRKGQRQRVAAILKCAAECDALGGDE